MMMIKMMMDIISCLQRRWAENSETLRPHQISPAAYITSLQFDILK